MSVSPVFGENVFPFGTHVYREPCLDLDAVLRDLPLLKDYGFNMIKIQEHWSADESREGEYEFSRVERLVQRADELELGVYLGLDDGASARLGLAEIPRLPFRLQRWPAA